MKIIELIQHLRGCDGCRCRDCELKDEELCNPILMEIAASVIEKLQKDNIKLHAFNDMNLGAREMLLEQIAELQKPQWISVEERLPFSEYGESKSVLTIDELGCMRVAYFDGGCWCHPTGELIETTVKFKITHWMPLPEPPKEETDG